MANQDIKMRVQYSAEFDTSKVANGLKELRKQLSNTHIGEDLRKQFETALSKVEVNIPALKKFAEKGEYNSKELEAFQKVILQVSKDIQALDKLAGEANFTKVFSEIDTIKVKEFEKQLNNVENKIKTFKKEIIESTEQATGKKIDGGMEGIVEQLLSVNPNEIDKKFDEIVEETIAKSEQAKQEIEEALSNRSKSFKQNSDVIDFLYGKDSGVTINRGFGGKAVEALQQAKEAIQGIARGEVVENASQKLERLYQLVTGTGEFEGAFNNPKGIKSAFDDIISVAQSGNFDKIKDLLPTLKEFSEKKFSFIEEAESERVKISAEYAQFLNERLQSLANTGQLTKEQIALISEQLGIMNGKIQDGSEYIKKEKTQIDAITATFGALAHRIEFSISALAVFNKSTQIIRRAIDSVKELDAAFTQIAIVSEQSGEQAWKLFDNFNKLAKQYSITTKDLTEGAKLFYQQGLNAADTMKMVEASTVSAALGEVTMTEAANTLTAAIQGYNESAAVAMDYTDKIAMVGAVSAADFNELSAAMEKTASSAYTAGIDFDHLLGYLGKMIEVTREAPANLGTAMKTIIARFEDMKKDPAKALEDGISFNKVEEALSTLGIAMRDTAGEFRPLQDVFTELGMQWESLTRNQQAYIATVAAGSRQQSRFLAMMNNFDRTLELITESQNSAGAAARQYATYQDSVAAAQARLTAAWEKFYSKIVDNDAIKIAINGLTKLVEALSEVPPAITAVGTAFGALTFQSFLQSKGGLINIIGKLLGASEKNETFIKFGKGLAETMGAGFKEAITKQGVLITDDSVIGSAINETVKSTIEGMGQLEKATTKTGNAFTILGGKISGALSGLVGLMANPTFWIVLGAAAIIGGIGYAIYKAGQKANDAAKKVEKLNKELSEMQEDSKNKKDLLDSYDELIKKTKRTEDEQKQLNNIIDQISDSYENAIIYIDEYGNRHLANIDTLKQENEQIDENIKKLKLQSIAAQKEFLNTPRSQWTKENTQQAGLPSEFYEQYNTIENGRLRDNSVDFQKENWKNFEETLRKNFSTYLNTGEAENFIKTALSFNDITLDTDDLSELLEGVNNAEQAIIKLREAYIKTGESVEDLELREQALNALVDRQKQKLDIEEWGINFERDPKYNGIVTYFQEVLKAIPTDKFNEKIGKNSTFGQQLEKEFEKMVKGITDPNKILKVQKFFEDFSNNVFEDNDEMKKAAEKAGIDVTTNFLKAMNAALEDRKKQQRQNTADALNYIFGTDTYSEDKFEGMTTEEQNQKVARAEWFSNNISSSGKHFERVDPYLQDIDKELGKAWENGTIEGYEAAKTKIIEDIPEELNKTKSVVEQYGEEEGKVLAEKLLNKPFIDAEQKLGDLISRSKELADKAYQAEGREATKEMNGLYEQGTYIDSETGKATVSTLEIISELQDNISYTLMTTEDSIRKIKNELAGLTDEDSERKEELETQLQLLIQQRKILSDQKDNLGQAAWGINLKYAKDYQSKLSAINSVQEKLSKKSFLNVDEMNQIYQIMPKFAEQFEEIEKGRFALKAGSVEEMKKVIKDEYEFELAVQRELAIREYDAAKEEYETLLEAANNKNLINKGEYEDAVKIMDSEVDANRTKDEDILDAADQAAVASGDIGKNAANNLVTIIREALQQIGKDITDFIDSAGNISWGSIFNEIQNHINAEDFKATIGVDFDLDNFTQKVNEIGQDKLLVAALDNAYARMQAAYNKIQALRPIDVEGIEDAEAALASMGDVGKDAIEDITKAIEDCADALEDLDKLLKDVQRDLKDITIDYNPFTDLFEAWEAEWDYYYNIKNLIKQLDTQSTMIDNVISADYTTAEEKLNAYDAKVGNLTWKMAANDAYITTLRAGIAQRAKQLEEEFNEYYNVDYRMGGWQIFQRDTALKDWEETINAAKEYSFELSKLINTQQNELNLLEANQEALEQQRGAYENILSTVDSLINTLSGNENITVDLSELQNIKVELEAAINDESVENIKEQIRNLNDYIQELDVQLDLNDKVVVEGLEEAYNRLKDEIDGVQELIDTLNEAVIEQQEYVQQLSEAYNMYVDTAISTQQELYDAIVEQYQDEINKKKEQYAYLKQLDNDYLQSVKDNINKERKAREDANKQQDFQKNLQRAQLLQQDTSGAYRNELANLNKEIENQRQDLYDDLVDKQVEALEKEIEKRHELYDLEVSAMEERLAYMQENAILLWDMVNGIVAGGATEMMALLENTTNYINQNELAKEKQRRQWEFNTQATYKGVIEGEIDSLEDRIKAEKEQLNTYKELQDAIELSTAAYSESKEILEEENVDFQKVMNSLMQTWTDMTSDLTGYNESWETTLTNIRIAMEKDINALSAMGDEGGSIYLLNEKLKQTANEMYQSFIDERTSYKETLENIIGNIQEQITTAITNAVSAIQDAADNIHFNDITPKPKDDTGGKGPSNDYTSTDTDKTDGSGEPTKKYSANVVGTLTDNTTGKSKTLEKDFSNLDSQMAIVRAANDWINEEIQKFSNELADTYERPPYHNKRPSIQRGLKYNYYKYGGFADFTGPAWLDGTKSQPEAVLNAKQTRLFTSMISSLERTAANNSNINSALGSSYNIGDINTNINVEKLDNETDIDRVARQVENRIMKSIRNRVVVSIA